METVKTISANQTISSEEVLAHKGERKQAIEHHQRGINLIKDGEPSLTLVRLYEEAALTAMKMWALFLAI